MEPRRATADFSPPQEIADIARENGLSVTALCGKADVAPSTFYRWLNGESVPKVDMIQKLVAAANAGSGFQDTVLGAEHRMIDRAAGRNDDPL